ncbi:hypothetical protein ACWCXB_07825 [Streptomyces sp. NPDC001514]
MADRMIAVRISTFPDGAVLAPADGLPSGPGPFLVAVTLDDTVISIVPRDVLEPLAAMPPSDLLTHLPPLVTVELDDDRIEETVLLDLADLFGLLPEVPGALVERDGAPVGVLTRADTAAALPLELLDDGSTRLGNAPDVPSRRYICRRCAPPSRRLPRSTAAGPPVCALVWSHGPMELEGG